MQHVQMKRTVEASGSVTERKLIDITEPGCAYSTLPHVPRVPLVPLVPTIVWSARRLDA